MNARSLFPIALLCAACSTETSASSDCSAQEAKIAELERQLAALQQPEPAVAASRPDPRHIGNPWAATTNFETDDGHPRLLLVNRAYVADNAPTLAILCTNGTFVISYIERGADNNSFIKGWPYKVGMRYDGSHTVSYDITPNESTPAVTIPSSAMTDILAYEKVLIEATTERDPAKRPSFAFSLRGIEKHLANPLYAQWCGL